MPGGFAKSTETVRETAARELREETGVEDVEAMGLKAVGLFSKPGRDPRGWVVSEAYTAVADKDSLVLRAGDDAAEAGWFQITLENGGSLICLVNGDVRLHVNSEKSDLAFDHGKILMEAMKLPVEEVKRHGE